MNTLAQKITLPGTSLNGLLPGGQFSSPADVVNQALKFIFFFAGFIMLVMLIIAGYQFVTSRGDPKALSQAWGRLTFAIVGFSIVFGAYWILILLDTVFPVFNVF